MAIDQKEREPAWQEAILLFMRFGIFNSFGVNIVWVFSLKSLPFLGFCSMKQWSEFPRGELKETFFVN